MQNVDGYSVDIKYHVSQHNVQAEVPKAERTDYPIFLRAMTQGRGVFTFRFERYEEVPGSIAQKIIEEAKNRAAAADAADARFVLLQIDALYQIDVSVRLPNNSDITIALIKIQLSLDKPGYT